MSHRRSKKQRGRMKVEEREEERKGRGMQEGAKDQGNKVGTLLPLSESESPLLGVLQSRCSPLSCHTLCMSLPHAPTALPPHPPAAGSPMVLT
eukprot:764648-Hanusia_phi.AAC.4